MFVNCDYCGKQFNLFPSRLKDKFHCCSKECSSNYKKEHRILNCTCDTCVIKFHKKQSQIKEHNFCSQNCHNKFNKIHMKGEGNHQYGLIGKLNASWKSDTRISAYGYKLIRCENHPFANSDGFVFEHRLVAEKYLINNENSIEINGKLYLSGKYHVHHINFNKLDNDVNNLYVVPKGIHIKFHNSLREIKRDKLGRIIKITPKYNLSDMNLMKKLFLEFINENKHMKYETND